MEVQIDSNGSDFRRVTKRIMKDIAEINYHLSVNGVLFCNKPEDSTVVPMQ